MNITELLREQALARPNQAAIIETSRGKDRTTTFAQLEQHVGDAAAKLHAKGLRPGDAVLVFVPMSVDLYVALLAIFQQGLVAMFLDPSAGKGHIERCCSIWPPKAFIAGRKAHLLRMISPSLRRIPLKFSVGGAVPGALPWSASSPIARPPQMPYACLPQDPALVTFTSGSTGLPKAAVRSHDFLLEQNRALASSLGLMSGAMDLTTLPIFVLANLAAGMTSLIPDADLRRPGKINPGPVIEQIDRYKPVTTGASPALLEVLADECLRTGRILDSLQRVFIGGAPVFPSLLDKVQEIAPQARIEAVYGSTEAEPIAHITRDEISEQDRAAMFGGRGLLAGYPVDCIHLRIMRNRWGTPIEPKSVEDFAEECLRAGEIGEIVVCGPHVLPGYLNGQGDEETKIHVDNAVWHRTGDAGYLDEQGRLWLLGRCVQIVRDSEGELFPFAVENAAVALPGVRRAALVAYQDRRVLVIEQDSRLVDKPALMHTLDWAKLSEVRVIKTLPMDKRHNAKVDYPALYKLLGGR